MDIKDEEANKGSRVAWVLNNPIVAMGMLAVVLLAFAFLSGWMLTWVPEYQEWLDNGATILSIFTIILAWPVAMMAWARRYDASHRFSGTIEKLPYISKSFEASLIIGVRPGNVLPEWHLCWIKPQTVAFLVSRDTWKNTKELIDAHQDQNIAWHFPPDENHRDVVQAPNDIKEVTEHCRILIRRMLDEGIAAERICVDIVGGTKPMSIGAFRAAEELGVTSIYLSGKGGKQLTVDELRDNEAVDIMLLSDHRAREALASG